MEHLSPLRFRLRDVEKRRQTVPKRTPHFREGGVRPFWPSRQRTEAQDQWGQLNTPTWH